MLSKFLYTLIINFFLLVSNLFANNIYFTDMNDCKTIDISSMDEYSTTLCEGPGDYKLVINSDDLREDITVIDDKGFGYPLNLWSNVSTEFSSIDNNITWMLQNKVPIFIKATYSTNKKNYDLNIKILPDCISLNNNCQKGNKTIGTIKALSVGDRTCYVTFDDEIIEMAHFHICENSNLLNKKVYLTYESTQVPSIDCEGNPDCKKYDTVSIINKAINIQNNSFCKTPFSKSIFSCSNANKKVNFCENPKTKQYKLKITGSKDIDISDFKKLKGNYTSFSGGGASWLNIDNRYTIYTGIGKWGNNGVLLEKQGILIGSNTLKCSNLTHSELGPIWFDKEQILDSDYYFELP